MNPGKNYNPYAFQGPAYSYQTSTYSGSSSGPSPITPNIKSNVLPTHAFHPSSLTHPSQIPPHPYTPPVNVDKLTSLGQKRKLFQELIFSLESTNNPDAIIAEIKYDYLISLYDSYTSIVKETASLERDSVYFDELIANAKETQQRVISLRGSLKKIMLNQSTPSSLASSQVKNQTDRVKVSDNNVVFDLLSAIRNLTTVTTEQIAADKSDLLDIMKDLDNNLTRGFEVISRELPDDQIKAAKSNQTGPRSIEANSNLGTPVMFEDLFPGVVKASTPSETIQQNPFANAEQIKSVKSNDKVVSKPAQLDELTNKTETMAINDAVSKPSEMNKEANQTAEKERESIFEILSKHFQKQNCLLSKIKLIQLNDVTSQDEIEMRSDYLQYLRKSFISNQHELEKFLNPSTRQQQQKLTQEVLKTLLDIEFKLDYNKHVV